MTRRLSDSEARECYEAAGGLPGIPYPGSGKPWPGVCARCGANISPTLNHIRGGGGVCRACGHERRVADRLEAAAAKAEADYRAAGGEPRGAFPGANRPWPGTCPEGHAIAPTVTNLRLGKGLCPRCSRARRAKEVRDQAAIVAERDYRAAGCTPDGPYPGAREPWPGRCPRGHRIAPTIDALRNGSFCMNCGRERTVAARRLDPAEAERIYRATGAIPSVPYPGSNVPWPGTCAEGHEIAPMLQNLRRGQGGCGECGTRKRGVSRRTDSAEAERIYREAGGIPSVPYPGRQKRAWPGLCARGHTIRPTLDHILHGYGVCHTCRQELGDYGFNPAKRGFVYLIRSSERVKIGIANKLEQRLSQHEWHTELVDSIEGDGLSMLRLEQQIKAALKSAGIPTGRLAWGDDKFNGWSETWPRERLDAESIVDLLTILELST